MLARLDEWLDAPGEAGWVVLTGGPGMGKSAILSAWLARREPKGDLTPCHFIRRQVADWDQPEVIAASLAAQIEAALPALRDPEAKPERRLLELLIRVSKQVGSAGRLVVVVDGLDETSAEPGENPLPRFLPHVMPAGIRFLCATRPTYPHLNWLEARSPVRRLDLDDARWAVSNKAVVRGFWEAVGSEYQPPLSAETVATVIARTEGNVLHAVMLHNALRNSLAEERRPDRIPRDLKALWDSASSHPAVLHDFRAHGLDLSDTSSPDISHHLRTSSGARNPFVSLRSILISVVVLVLVFAIILLFVVFREGHRSIATPPICQNGIEFVRLPGGPFESGNAAERAPKRQLTVSTFYASKYALPSLGAHGSACSSSPEMPPIGQWKTAAAFCEQQNARLITETEWEFLARTSPENLEPGEIEFTHDCWYDRSSAGHVPPANPTSHKDGCILHIGRGLSIDDGNIDIRSANPAEGRYRCVWSSGLDPDGRVYRWLILGPIVWGGPDTPFPEISKLLSGKPRLGDRFQWRSGKMTGDGQWLAYEPHFDNKRSTSSCKPIDRACLNHKYYSADIGCFLFKKITTSGGHAAFLQSYLAVSKARRVRFSVAADDNFQLWLDGEPIAKYVGPPTCLDEFDEKNEPRETWSNTDIVDLPQGDHRLTAVVGDTGNSWLFSVRILSEDWAPITDGIFATLDPDDGSVALPLNLISIPPVQ